MGEQSGPAGDVLLNYTKAVQAWVAGINGRGGFRCRPLRYIVADDGGDPARNQALTRKLVEEDGVVAFVANNAPIAGHASVKYLTDKRIPAIGSEGGSQWYYQSPVFFPQMSSGFGLPLTQFGVAADIGMPAGLTKVGTLSCVEAEACSAYADLGPKWAQRFGMQQVYAGRASLVQPDYTAHCQAAQAAGAQLLLIGTDTNSTSRIARSCASVNYRPLFVVPISIGQHKMLSNPQLEGLVVAMPVLPWMITSNPGIVEYQQVLKRYAPSLPYAPATIGGWVAAKLFEAAIQKLPEINSETILEAMWSIKNNDLGGLTYPLTFTKGQNAPEVLCYWQAQIKDGQFISPNGGRQTCPSGWPSFKP